jgi:hypothetical protein
MLLFALLLLALLLFAMLLLALPLFALLFLLLRLQHNKVAYVAPLAEEALHLDGLPELRGVISVRGSRRRGPARQLNAVLLVDMLTHLLTIYCNIAAAAALLNNDCCPCCCPCCSSALSLALAAAAAADERILRFAKLSDIRA